MTSQVIDRLIEGNHRFASGRRYEDGFSQSRRSQLASGQSPFAVVIGCSDSRVPVEAIFDQGLGDLFVVRVAGNVVAATQLGSVEFAVGQFGCELIVVLGHTRCGAIEAALRNTEEPREDLSPNLREIVNCIQPAIDEILDLKNTSGRGDLVRAATRVNITNSIGNLTAHSQLLKARVQAGKLDVRGAEYDLETGLVEFI